MSNEVSIFKNRDVVVGKQTPSALTQSLMKAKRLKRISPRKGKFVRIVNGESAGKLNEPVRVVIVGVAPANAQRSFYIEAYDPSAEKAAPPDCWSNDGNKPDANVKTPQGATCETCPQNIKGSGQGTTRACRFERRIAVVLPEEVGGNNHGDVYQLKLPSKSIFGKGAGQLFPLNAYIDYVIANGENIDGVVTELSFDEDDNVRLRAVDFVASHPELQAIVEEAVTSPEVTKAITLTVAAVDKGDGDEDFETAPAPKQEAIEEPIAEPVKRASKKPVPEPTQTKSLADVVSAWSADE